MSGNVQKKAYGLRREDYEFYKINLPVSVFLKRDCKRFVYSELGKLHPCFSEDWTFDSKVLLGKKGLEANVIVLEKKRLAEFRVNNPFKALKLEDGTSQSFFIPSKLKVLVTAAVCLAVLVIFVFVFSAGKNKTKQVQTEKNVEIKKLEISNEVNSEEMKIQRINEQLEKLGELVNKRQAYIRYFMWQSSAANENIRLIIKGVFPEELENYGLDEFKLISIAYEGNVPLLQINAEAKKSAVRDISSYKNTEQSVSESNTKYPRGEVRELVQTMGGTVQEESVEPYRLHFYSKDGCGSGTVEIIQKVCRLLNNSEVVLSRVKIEGGNGEMEFGYKRSAGENGDEIISVLKSQNFDEFIPKTEEKKKTVISVKKEDRELKVEKKIGEVRHKDGSIYLFFKNEEGKIETRRIK